MKLQDGFLNEIIYNPIEISNYLIFADWLIDNQKEDLSNLIRIAFDCYNEKIDKLKDEYIKLQKSIVYEINWFLRYNNTIERYDIGKRYHPAEAYVLYRMKLTHEDYRRKDATNIVKNVIGLPEDNKIAILLLFINEIYHNHKIANTQSLQESLLLTYLDSHLYSLNTMAGGMNNKDDCIFNNFDVIEDFEYTVSKLPKNLSADAKTYVEKCMNLLISIRELIKPECVVNNINYSIKINNIIDTIRKNL